MAMLKKLVIVLLIITLIMPSTVTVFASSNEQPSAEVIFSCEDAVYYEVLFFVVLVYLPFGVECIIRIGIMP